MGRAKPNRGISSAELAVLRAALAVAPTTPDSGRHLEAAERLRVIGACDCVCDTVDFARAHPGSRSYPVADAVGTTPGGGTVGLLVFGTEEELTSLEVYGICVREDGIRLPTVESIRPMATYLPE